MWCARSSLYGQQLEKLSEDSKQNISRGQGVSAAATAAACKIMEYNI
jgi:hypothetical protein